jgi:hypothetical protein
VHLKALDNKKVTSHLIEGWQPKKRVLVKSEEREALTLLVGSQVVQPQWHGQQFQEEVQRVTVWPSDQFLVYSQE